MTQPDDEETREQPAFPEPLAPTAPAPVPPGSSAPGPTPAQPPMGGPPPPMASPPVGSMPAHQPPPQSWQSTPVAPTGWQQPAPGWQQPQQPGPNWQQQQPPPGWQPQPPGQWQGQPPYGAPTPGWQHQPQTWAAQPQHKTSTLVVLGGLVLIVFGLLVTVLGGWTMTQGPEIGRFIRDNDIAIFGRQIERDTLRAVLSPMPGVLMGVGLLQLLVGAVLFTHRGWSRWLGILLALLGLVVAVVALSATVALVPGVSIALAVSAILVLGYAFVILALIAGGSHFRAPSQGR